MTKKNPSILTSIPGLTATTRRSIGKYTKRTKKEGEAGPRTQVVSKVIGFPKMESTRPGADDHTRIGRRGYFC